MSKSATGKALQYYRKRANLTQTEVAKRLGKSQQWVSDIENVASVLYWGDIKKLCQLYGTTPSELQKKEEELS